ncbi:MAG TPA: protein kinase [Ktedonobacteraceae bacterium]|jgi:serine/threonine protein kinase
MQQKFHQYNLTTELAKKYSHSTYLASPINPQGGHSEPEHQVVLTVFASSLFHFPHEREKMLLKAKHIKKLQHPHLVSILDVGIEQEQPFVVREYLPNGSLRNRLKKLSPHHLELREALSIVSQVGQALVYAHEHDIFHGTLKPENILFDAGGQAVLTDFNLVSRNDAIIRDQTAEEYAFCYLAPEQFAGTCDASSDQYALGCLAYELITGRVPFAVQSLASMIGQHNNPQPIPLSESVADLSPSLEAAVLKALSKDPEERFYDFSLFLEVIQSVLSPSPAFPLARSTHSRSNRTASHSAQSAKAETISSPIRRRAVDRPAAMAFSSIRKLAAIHTDPLSLEPSKDSSNVEADRVEPTVTPLTPQASMPEAVKSPPLPESLETVLQSHQNAFPFSKDIHPLSHKEQPLEELEHNKSSAFTLETMPQSENLISEVAVITPISEQEIDNLLLRDPFAEEDVHAIVPESSIFWQDEDADAKPILSLMRDIDVPEIQSAQTAPTLRSRRRVLERVLLLSVIVALIASAFWAVAMFAFGGRLLPSQKMTRTVITGIKSAPRVQSSAQAITIPVVQPTVNVTSVPTAQLPTPASTPIPRSTPIPISRSTPISTPTPKPTATPSTSFEAEATNNTNNGTKTFSCNLCSGGLRVGWISYDIFLQFNNVNVNQSGDYTLKIYYLNSIPNRVTSAFVSVNGGPNVAVPGLQVLTVDCCDNIPPQVTQMTVQLQAGDNTIEISSPTDYAPDIDRIVVG